MKTPLNTDTSSTTDYEQLTLDAGGNVTSRRLRDGQSIGYTFDALNRLTAKNLPGTEPDATYAYDLLGRMTSAAQNAITNAMTWDALGRMLTETAPQGTTTSIYDLAGRRTRVTLPGATSLFADYVYDVLGNVTFIKENGANSGVGLLATYQYDSLSRRSSVTFGNGVVQSYSYDNASRLATQTNDLASTANDLTQTFAYNPASQISSVTRSNDLYAWTGHANQNDSSTPNGLNQITNICPLGGTCKTVTHDGNGNITAVGADSYGYSSENFLTSGPSSTTLNYDPMGRLYQVANGGGTTRMGYDGLDRIAEYDGSNAVLRRYIHGPGIDNPIIWYEGSAVTSGRHFLSADERGSIIASVSGSGALQGLNTYDEYGVPQTTNLGKFGYTGQTWVPEIKLWYYKTRFYRADIGRFIQSDPIGYEGGPNLYAYVLNDPVNLIDPLGLDDCPQPEGEIVVCGKKIKDPCRYQRFCGPFGGFTTGFWIVDLLRIPIDNKGHRYREKEQVCNRPLSEKERGELLRRSAVPGHAGQRASNGLFVVSTAGVIPGGVVSTKFSPNFNQVTSVTTFAHVFVGSITRTIAVENGATFITTVGLGNAGPSILGAMRDTLNQQLGPAVFSALDEQASDLAEAMFEGC